MTPEMIAEKAQSIEPFGPGGFWPMLQEQMKSNEATLVQAGERAIEISAGRAQLTLRYEYEAVLMRQCEVGLGSVSFYVSNTPDALALIDEVIAEMAA